ncbi:hypothetical protein PCANC_23224 [Puccinia coronata f. sp. avenae]|uniref:Uncharacterized protein n=1 Tax=Puccinia coronata f. sp. avenae TaxID=200324 RepID=A0A2N5TNN1_9BASI|nr:hypothetical protein PCANC_23224 [Puccinia coronata f. sp. avenae]
MSAPVYSPKNPPEDPLTDTISQGPQGVNSGGLGNIRIFEYLRYPRQIAKTTQTVKADSSSRWKHGPRLLRPTAPAAGSIGLTCCNRRLQLLGPLVSVSETDGSSSWNHWSQFPRPTAPAAGTIGLSFQDRRLQQLEVGTIGLSFRDQRLQQLEPLVSLAETDSSSCWEHWSQFLRPTASAVGSIGRSF